MTLTVSLEALRGLTFDDVLRWLGVVTAALLVYSPFAKRAFALSQRLAAYAATTPTPHDDRVARVLVAVAGFLSRTIELLVAWLPRISVGLQELHRAHLNFVTQADLDARRRAALDRPPRVPPAALLVLLVLLPLSGACSGAGIQPARTTLLVVDGLVDRASERVAPLYAAAHERALEEAESREAYDETMRPWVRAHRALETTQVALVSAATTIEAVEAGRAGDVAATMACVVEALAQLAEALPAVGVELSSQVRTGRALLEAFAGAACVVLEDAS